MHVVVTCVLLTPVPHAQFFYEEQQHRLESFLQEPVQFEDLLCQLHDMLLPAQDGCFTLRDLKAVRGGALLAGCCVAV